MSSFARRNLINYSSLEWFFDSLIETARFAPSGDNCQPWRFRVEGDQLQIHHIAAIAAHSLNVNNHASLISLGCLLEIISIESQANGFTPHFHYLEGLGTEQSAWVNITFTPHIQQSNQENLRLAIAQRCTDRRAYKKGNFPNELKEELFTASQSYPKARFSILTNGSVPLLWRFAVQESRIWSDKGCQQDLLKWIRISSKEKSQDGMPWQTLGVSWLVAQSLRLQRNFIWQKVVNFFGFRIFTTLAQFILLRSSSALVLVTVREYSNEALIESGKLMMNVWLRLFAKDFAGQPVSTCSLSVYDAKKCNPNRIFWQKALRLLPSIRREFGLLDDETPTWMLRVGHSPKNSAPRSPRLPVDVLLHKNRNSGL